jgi:hypothetical protein
MTDDRALGYLPDEHDERDAVFGAPRLGTRQPRLEAVSHLHSFRRWRDQGASNSCVGHGVVQQVEAARARAGLPEVALSPLGAYTTGRLYMGPTLVDTGSRPRDVLRGGAKLGIAREASWPLDLDRINERLPAELEAEGVALKGSYEYQRVGVGLTGAAFVDAVLDALQFGPVGWGRQVRASYLEHKGEDVLPAPTQDERVGGGHYTVIVASRLNGAEILDLNSWGGWGFSESVSVGVDRRVTLHSLGWLDVAHLLDGWVDAWQVKALQPATVRP